MEVVHLEPHCLHFWLYCLEQMKGVVVELLETLGYSAESRWKVVS